VSPPGPNALENAQVAKCGMICLGERCRLFIIGAQFPLVLDACLLIALLSFFTEAAQRLFVMVAQEQVLHSVTIPHARFQSSTVSLSCLMSHLSQRRRR
jgi:hypothetical protein